MRRGYPPSNRKGVVLLEVIVALAILTTAGLWMVAMSREAAASVTHAQRADQEIEKASTFLDAVALWPREDLDRHLGDRAEGAWILRVDRPTPTLYTIALRTAPDTTIRGSRGRLLLETVLYRPEPHATP